MGSPASRRSTNFTPLTTRPSFTSRQGMRRILSTRGTRDRSLVRERPISNLVERVWACRREGLDRKRGLLRSVPACMSVSSCYGFTDSRLETGIVGQDFCRAFAMVVDGDRPAPGVLLRLMIAFQHMEKNQPVEAHQLVELASSQGLDLLGDVLPVELVEPAGAQQGALLARPGVEIVLVGRPVLGRGLSWPFGRDRHRKPPRSPYHSLPGLLDQAQRFLGINPTVVERAPGDCAGKPGA